MDYLLAEAGVWTDCVVQKKPVIHNDYASLPHRKGLPEGHAVVVRQLVVPILRDSQVAAILGVGNKASDYNEQDTALVAYIADLVRSIIEQKRTDERIRRLNTKLERLAMTDDLTGLMNRRAFVKNFESEAGRVERYNTPLSIH